MGKGVSEESRHNKVIHLIIPINRDFKVYGNLLPLHRCRIIHSMD